MQRFFRTLNPDVLIYCRNGRVVRFRSVDGIEGWYATDIDYELAAIDNCIAKGIGGQITEVDEAAYRAWLGKYGAAPEFRPDREALSPGTSAAPSTASTSHSPSTSTSSPSPTSSAAVAGKTVETVVDEPAVLRKRGRPSTK